MLHCAFKLSERQKEANINLHNRWIFMHKNWPFTSEGKLKAFWMFSACCFCKAFPKASEQRVGLQFAQLNIVLLSEVAVLPFHSSHLLVQRGCYRGKSDVSTNPPYTLCFVKLKGQTELSPWDGFELLLCRYVSDCDEWHRPLSLFSAADVNRIEVFAPAVCLLVWPKKKEKKNSSFFLLHLCSQMIYVLLNWKRFCAPGQSDEIIQAVCSGCCCWEVYRSLHLCSSWCAAVDRTAA